MPAVIDPDELWPLMLADGLALSVEYRPPSLVLAPVPCDAEPGPVFGQTADVGDGGRLGLPTRQWSLRAASLGATEVERSGRVVDGGGTEWVVDRATLTALETVWTCQTVRVPAAADFDGTATVRRPAATPAAGGLPVQNAADLEAGVPCSLWPQTTAAEWDQNEGRLLTRTRATVCLGAALNLQAGDHVVFDGATWELVQAAGPDRLGLVTAATVERVY